ncbi:hypothetical protein GCM10009673_15200 [Nesterenkonia sandarakina]
MIRMGHNLSDQNFPRVLRTGPPPGPAGGHATGKSRSISFLQKPVNERFDLKNSECGAPLMATDYDAPRKNDDETSEDSIEELKNRNTSRQSSVVDEDETEAAEGFELPGADLSEEELQVRVLPAQSDEFTCSSCFLVRHRSQVAREENGMFFCKDCEA